MLNTDWSSHAMDILTKAIKMNVFSRHHLRFMLGVSPERLFTRCDTEHFSSREGGCVWGTAEREVRRGVLIGISVHLI